MDTTEIIDSHYEASLDTSIENFKKFIEVNNSDLDVSGFDNSDIDYLVKRIAQNMFLYKQNINTAKSDFITLIGLLMKKGLILN